MEKITPKGFRRPDYEEYSGRKPLGPTEKLRTYNHDYVIVDMGPEYQKRLQELREKSKELNKLLQEKLKEKDLPLSTRKSHNEAARITIEFRPLFVASEEKKDEGERMTGAKDEVIIYIHLDNDNNYNGQRVRYSSIMFGLGLAETFDPDFNAHVDKEEKLKFKDDIKKFNLPAIAEYISDKLPDAYFVQMFKQFKHCVSANEAAQLLEKHKSLITMLNTEIVTNLLKLTLRAIYMSIGEKYGQDKNALTKVAEEAETQIKKYLELEVEMPTRLSSFTKPIREIIVDHPENDTKMQAFINNAIQGAKDAYKTAIYQKNKLK